ncbi:MAG: 3'(2'),5'-bisphosphate nucleotidase CysQ [Alphaproteobacteria bacterium]|nr:3'(2'),5'-bisphosphate nucleotidase CysQ [Alphaproteobacteria bacterium]
MPGSEARIDPRDETQKLEHALRAAGAIALKFFRGNVRSWFKSEDSPVSEADIAVDRFLREVLARPDIGWLSEESEDDLSRLEARRLYIVDPIDGTRSYLAGRPDWSIAAALVEDGRPVAAAIFAPTDDEMFVATAGGGASLNGRPLHATPGSSLRGARIAGPQRYLDRLAQAAPDIVRAPKIHSLALRLARVAEGRIDAGLASVHAHDWDLAAADLLVHEAGGGMTDASGNALVYNLHNPMHGALIAAGRDRHQAVLALMGDSRMGDSRTGDSWKQLS